MQNHKKEWWIENPHLFLYQYVAMIYGLSGGKMLWAL